jgi:hypothetical protein
MNENNKKRSGLAPVTEGYQPSQAELEKRGYQPVAMTPKVPKPPPVGTAAVKPSDNSSSSTEAEKSN